MPQDQIGPFLDHELNHIQLEDFIGLSKNWSRNVIQEELGLYSVNDESSLENTESDDD